MKEFENKSILKDLFYSKLSILVILLFIYTLSKGSYAVWQKYRETNLRESEAVSKLEQLDENKIRLENEVLFFRSDVGVESILRTDYSLIRPEEKLIVIVGEEEVIEIEEDHSFLDKTMSWFRSKNLVK